MANRMTQIASETKVKRLSAPPGLITASASEAELQKLIDSHSNGTEEDDPGYGVAFGIKRGTCGVEGCDSCPHYEPAEDAEGGVCINCGHNPNDHEMLGKLNVTGGGSAEKNYDMNDIDPLGLLKEPGEEAEESPQELEARKKLQEMCEWKIDGSELRFLEKLGSGQAAKVYKGKYQGKFVAIKVLRPIVEEKQMKNFKKELDVMSAIVSPFVVQFFGGCLYPKICLVMEYCSNGSVFHLLQRKDLDLTWDIFFRLCLEISGGVAALHGMDPPIVHRDLKSLNLLVDEALSVKVCDFGLSRFTGGGDESTLQKMRGTYAYTAPEVYFGEKYSTKSDVYSVGIILWELVARCITQLYHRPYKEYPQLRLDFQIIIATAKKGTRPRIPKGCPEALCELMKRCWAKAPEERPDAVEVVEELKKVQQQYEANRQAWDSVIMPKVDLEEEKRKKAEADKKRAEEQLKKLKALKEKKLKEAEEKKKAEAEAAAKAEAAKAADAVSAPAANDASSAMFQHAGMDDLIAKLSQHTPDQQSSDADSPSEAPKVQEKKKLKRTSSFARLKGAKIKKSTPAEPPPSSDEAKPSIGAPNWTRFGKDNWMEEDSFEDDSKKKKKKESKDREKKRGLFGRKSKKLKLPKAAGASTYQDTGDKAVIRVFHWEHGSYATLAVKPEASLIEVRNMAAEKFHLGIPAQYSLHAVTKKDQRRLDDWEYPAVLIRENQNDSGFRLWIYPEET